jgi:hypothetical protein
MVHKKGIKPVSNPRLLRRSGVYYYRRRVPAHLVKRIGKSVVQVSLQTTTIKEAKRLRTLNDLEWDARFAAAEESLPEDEGECLGSGPVPPSPPVSESDWCNSFATTSSGRMSGRGNDMLAALL